MLRVLSRCRSVYHIEGKRYLLESHLFICISEGVFVKETYTILWLINVWQHIGGCVEIMLIKFLFKMSFLFMIWSGNVGLTFIKMSIYRFSYSIPTLLFFFSFFLSNFIWVSFPLLFPVVKSTNMLIREQYVINIYLILLG